jgi:hypothetical protein
MGSGTWSPAVSRPNTTQGPITIKYMTMTENPSYLFIAVYPNAFMYTDQIRETNGDFHEIAAIYFRPLTLKIFDKATKYAEAIAIATNRYQEIMSDITKPIVISATGQTVQPCLPPL